MESLSKVLSDSSGSAEVSDSKFPTESLVRASGIYDLVQKVMAMIGTLQADSYPPSPLFWDT